MKMGSETGKVIGPEQISRLHPPVVTQIDTPPDTLMLLCTVHSWGGELQYSSTSSPQDCDTPSTVELPFANYRWFFFFAIAIACSLISFDQLANDSLLIRPPAYSTVQTFWQVFAGLGLKVEVFLYCTFACYRLVVKSSQELRRFGLVWFVVSYLPRSPFLPSFLIDCPLLKPKPKLFQSTPYLPSSPLFLYLFIISSTLNVLVFNF